MSSVVCRFRQDHLQMERMQYILSNVHNKNLFGIDRLLNFKATIPLNAMYQTLEACKGSTGRRIFSFASCSNSLIKIDQSIGLNIPRKVRKVQRRAGVFSLKLVAQDASNGILLNFESKLVGLIINVQQHIITLHVCLRSPPTGTATGQTRFEMRTGVVFAPRNLSVRTCM